MSEAINSSNAAADAKKTATKTTATSSSGRSSSSNSSANSRPIHPAVVTTFGPGKGSGASELSVWAYLTRPRPFSGNSCSSDNSNNIGNASSQSSSAPLPNLVTAQSNSLRVYTVLPNAGTLALTAIYDNLAGSICSLDVVPHGTSGGDGEEEDDEEGGSNAGSDDGGGGNAGLAVNDDGLHEIFADDTANTNGNNNDDSNNKSGSKTHSTCSYDGLLLGFAGHPRLSLVYPSTPMIGSQTSSGGVNNSNVGGGVGQGGVLLASSIVDLTPALIEKSFGGGSYLEQDMIVTVSNNTDGEEGTDPCVSVVLGGGVAVASFSLPKGRRPDEGGGSSSSAWWRVASEPYILPLSTLSSKIHSLGGKEPSAASAPSATSNIRGGRNQPTTSAAVGAGPALAHGFGDVVDIAYLSGYTEPTLLILHTNPKKGKVWPGRLGRTAEVPIASSSSGDDHGDDDGYGKDDIMDIGGKKKRSVRTMDTGTKYGLTLTAISLAIHQHRSVVLWSLIDAMPQDGWTLVPHPTDGVLVWGVNTIVYVSMGGKVKCALAVNGFAKVGCPSGLLPPSTSPFLKSTRGGGNGSTTAVHLEPNPSPLPNLALQLDGSRVSFVTNHVAMVCLTNGTLHSLELHNNSSSSRKNAYMSLFPLGHKVGGLGVASCLSVVSSNCHSGGIGRYLVDEDEDKDGRGTKGATKKEEDQKPVAVVSKSEKADKPSSSLASKPKIQARGLVFVGSRMGDCTLLAFSMNESIRLVVTDVDAEEEEDTGADADGGKRKSADGKVEPDKSSSMSGEGDEPAKKQAKLEEKDSEVVEILDDVANAADSGNTDNGDATPALTEEEILRLEEEELYRLDDGDAANGVAAPSIISSSNVDSDEYDDEQSNAEEDSHDEGTAKAPRRRTARHLSKFQSIRALDSLTGLGPLGGGIYGPVATCPSLTSQDANTVVASTTSASEVAASMFSTEFSSAARHYIMPCGFGASGGLAVLTTPGRDNVGGSILCESDLCNMAGQMFGLSRSNLVLLGKVDGVGVIALRGVVREEEEDEENGKGCVEEFEELDIDTSGQATKEEGGDGMDVDGAPSFHNATDVLAKMTMLAATEFSSESHCFSVFFVQAPHLEGNDPYSIVIMSNDGNKESKSDIGLSVNFVHRIEKNNDKGMLSSITPMVSKVSGDDGGSAISSITFGCAWTSGNASVFNISLGSESAEGEDGTSSLPIDFKVSESMFAGGDNEEVNFYDSNKIVGIDIISLPNHIFDTPNSASSEPEEKLPVTSSSSATSPTPDQSTSLSFPPDRLSMHGTWCAKLGGHTNEPPTPNLSQNRVVIAICRRSGLLQIYDNEDTLSSPLVEVPSPSSNTASPIWEANGCSHGTAILGQSSPGVTIRRPEHHEVEAAEIRFFVAGPSLKPESTDIDAEKDSWMLRSLCILVDTSQGDLHLYSGSKRRSNMNRLEFSRVPLSNVSRPSDEANRHLIKLRRKGIVPAATRVDFRPNRLHRFCGISGEDGLFAATPRPLWFVAERGAMTVVSHKSRHVSPAGGRSVPVSGFCTSMPDVFQNASKGFITMHERIGRVGSQRLTLYNGLWDVFAPHGLIPGSGISIQKVPLGVTVRHIEFIDDASISTTSRPVYAMLVSHEIEGDQSYLNDDGLSPEVRQQIRDEKEAARVRKQVEADLGGFDMEQEWVEEIERENCFTIDRSLGLAPPMPTRKYELWLVDASSQWNVLDKYQLDDFEHGTALKVMFLTDVVEDSDEPPERSLVIGVGTSVIDQDGEDLASKGRILLFQVKKSKKRSLNKPKKDTPLELMLKSEKEMALGPVTSLSSLKSEDIYRIVVGAGAEVTVEQWGGGKLTQMGFYHAHMQVQQIVLFKTFFLLSDAYDSLHFLVWRESDKSLTLLAKDWEPTQVFAAGLISRGGAMSFVCHDDRQNLSFLQYAPTDAAARGGNKLVCRADFHMGTQTTSLNSHYCQSSLLFNSCTTTSTLAALKQQDTLFGRLEDDQRFAVNFGTSDGSFASIIPLSEPTYWRLTALQSVMSNALESNCALSHRAWRLYRRSTRRAGCRSNDRKKGVIDGDIVMKFVDLPLPEQEDLASSIGSTVGLVMDNLLELGCAASVV